MRGIASRLDADLLLGRLREHHGHRAADLEDVGEEVAGDEGHGFSLPVALEMDRRDDRLALGHLLGRPRQLGPRGGVPGARVVERLAADDLAVADELDQQRPVVAVVLGRGADADHLGLGDAVAVEPAQRVLAAADGDLVDALLRDRHHHAVVALAGDELVDEAAGRVAAAGDQLGADAVAVDRGRGERGDRVLVEVAGHHDPGPRRAEVVELLADLVGQHAEVAGVEADRAELRAGDLDAARAPPRSTS